jgi:hypothetical protein
MGHIIEPTVTAWGVLIWLFVLMLEGGYNKWRFLGLSGSVTDTLSRCWTDGRDLDINRCSLNNCFISPSKLDLHFAQPSYAYRLSMC